VKLHGTPQLEPGRSVFVLLHKDETHVASLPNGEADWSYNRADMQLREQILNKDFGNQNYGVVTLTEALTRISNKQGELMKQWTPALNAIKRTRKLEDAWELYAKARKALGAHPLEADPWLRKKLQID
jgi:hypothetical protein